MNSGRIFWGLTLIAIGVLLLLDRMYVLDFSDIVHTYWPLLLVLWGISVLLRRSGGTRVSTVPATPTSGAESGGSSASAGNPGYQLNSSNTFGDTNLRVDSKEFRGGSVSTVFGNTEVDLRDAVCADGEQALKLHGVFGDTKIWLARDMAYAVSSSTVFGEVIVNDQKREGFSPSLSFESQSFAAASKRLRIDASQVFGNIEIRS